MEIKTEEAIRNLIESRNRIPLTNTIIINQKDIFYLLDNLEERLSLETERKLIEKGKTAPAINAFMIDQKDLLCILDDVKEELSRKSEGE